MSLIEFASLLSTLQCRCHISTVLRQCSIVGFIWSTFPVLFPCPFFHFPISAPLFSLVTLKCTLIRLFFAFQHSLRNVLFQSVTACMSISTCQFPCVKFVFFRSPSSPSNVSTTRTKSFFDNSECQSDFLTTRSERSCPPRGRLMQGWESEFSANI